MGHFTRGELSSSSVTRLQLEDARRAAAAAADDAERWERRFLDERTLRRNVRRSLRAFPHICFAVNLPCNTSARKTWIK